MLVQKLACFNGVGGAVKAQISYIVRDGKDYHQIVTLDKNNRVVELAEFPFSWGIWTCREFLMSSDLKAAGRTTNAYDQTPPI